MKRLKNIIKNVVITFFAIILIIVIAGGGYYFAVTKDAHLDENKINNSTSYAVSFYDTNNNEISNLKIFNDKTIPYDSLQKHTIDAFVEIEDKRFFSHHGIDYYRIFGAIKNNILHPKTKQGASTITQQVIKNTQLSSEKTIKRKLKEFKLAKALEKKYSKEQIMEIYLNSIYFGNGAYGINKASKLYFNKSADNLTIAESALLASTINAPSVYDPISHPEKAKTRKELILKLMKDNGKITQSQYDDAINENIKITRGKNFTNQYNKAVISEACNILKVTENQLKNMDLKIHTYFDEKAQSLLESSTNIDASQNNLFGSILLDNTSLGVVALCSNASSPIQNLRRQPGSSIKPILVYAPAFESGKYYPASIVKDEPISIGNYSPENANKKYSGDVSIRQSIAKSINIPAVKILNNVGINYSKNFAQNLGIPFDEKDNNLALALGGFTKGTTIKELADAYMCFANGGNYSNSMFIKEIYNQNELVFKRSNFSKQAMSQETAYMITSCLLSTSKQGTARRLSTLPYDVASKTGTVGTNNGNTDAYNICYTTSHTLCTWIGAKDNLHPMQNINGANYPTSINKNILSGLYTLPPQNFSAPPTIQEKFIDEDTLTEGIINICENSSIKDIFSINKLPPVINQNLSLNIEIDNFQNNQPIIKFTANRANIYEIYRKNDNNLQFLKEIKFNNGQIEYMDTSAENNKLYEYFVVIKNKNSKVESNHIKLITS